jgi:hypothetical protein
MKDKITKEEFYDVYGASLLIDKVDNEHLLKHLTPIIKKYIKVTHKACMGELEHCVVDIGDYFADPGDYWSEEDYKNTRKENNKLLLSMNTVISDDLSFSKIAKLFNNGVWDVNYGGEKWGTIAETCNKLQASYQRKNLKHILFFIDHLNDLEHNNALYLSDFVTFTCFCEECAFKSTASEEAIIMNCSQTITRLYNKSKSLVAQYHQ